MLYNIVVSSVTANGLRLGEGGGLEVLMFDLAQMSLKSTNVQFSTETPLSPNRCCMPFLFFGQFFLYFLRKS